MPNVTHVVEDGVDKLEIISTSASYILEHVPGAVLVGADAEAPIVRVPWTQQSVEILTTLRAPYLPLMSNTKYLYPWAGFESPMQHQYRMTGFLASHQRGFCLADPGCVDGDTEYLSPTGWIPIRDYTGGDVMQYEPEAQTASFVKPLRYINEAATTMLKFSTSRGIDMVLSGQHRVVYKDKFGGTGTHTTTALDIADKHWRLASGFKGGIPTAFTLSASSAVPYTDAQIRVIVMYVADGTFDARRPNSNTVTVNLKKPRKKDRLMALLHEAGIAYKSRESTVSGYTVFSFPAPVRTKDLGLFWGASKMQLAVIADEALHWDGSLGTGRRIGRFSTTSKTSADLVQYAFSANGTRASIQTCTRTRAFPHPDKVYMLTGTEYTVSPSGHSEFVSLHHSTGGSAKDLAVQIIDAPGSKQYCFEVPTGYLVLRRNNRVFCTGNTGKTATTTWAADFLIGSGAAKSMLVVCPKSLMNVAWRDELNKICPARTVSVITGDKAKRIALVNKKADVDIINFDGVEIVYDQLKARKYDIVVVDESTAYKNESTTRWMWLRALVKDVPRLWLLTGTPCPQSPEDAHGQIRLMYGEKWAVSKGKWKEMTMTQVGPFRWIPKKEAPELIRTHMQPAIYVSKRDAMPNMPPIMLTQREVELSSQQQKLIKSLKKDLMATVGAAGITAVHAAALRLKIVQIASGSVYDDEREVIELDNSSRDSELVSIVQQVRAREFNDGTANNKLVVFCAFKHTVNRVVEMLSAKGIRAVALTGDNTPKQRDAAITALQKGTEVEVLVAIADIAAHGLTFTAASTTVWYSPVTKAELYIQANNRMDRPGQKQHMEITRLYACEAEKLMYNTLSDKLTGQSDVLSGYAQLVESL